MTNTARRVAGAVKARVHSAFVRASRLVGVETHLDAESRSYWEERGTRYPKEVASILDPSDPYFQAQKQFLDELAEIHWSSILEIGCGFGWHLRPVAERFAGRRVVGLDFSFTQLLQGRAYLAGSPASTCQASAFQIPFADDSFDIVFTSGMLICVHPKQLRDVLSELTRVARRSLITLEYAREHINTPERLSIMRGAGWYAHRYALALEEAELKVVSSYVFPSFAPNRIPLSFFHGVKI